MGGFRRHPEGHATDPAATATVATLKANAADPAADGCHRYLEANAAARAADGCHRYLKVNAADRAANGPVPASDCPLGAFAEARERSFVQADEATSVRGSAS